MLVFRQPEHVGHFRARVEGALRARVERQDARAVPLGHDGMRLEIALVHHRHAVGLLEDQVGLGEALGHVAALQPRLLGDIDRLRRWGIALDRGHPRMRERLAGVGLGPRIRHRWRPDQHRLERVDRRGQHLVLDLDQVERLLGDGQLVRGHRGHRLADEDHPIDGEHRMGARRGFLLQMRDVGGGEHGAHARQRFGLARVDADDLGVGMRAPEELRLQHAARLDVGDVLDVTRDLVRAVGTGDGETDSLDLARRLHDRHGVIPFERVRRPRSRRSRPPWSCTRCSGRGCRQCRSGSLLPWGAGSRRGAPRPP